jgi:hypothetical protein
MNITVDQWHSLPPHGTHRGDKFSKAMARPLFCDFTGVVVGAGEKPVDQVLAVFRLARDES